MCWQRMERRWWWRRWRGWRMALSSRSRRTMRGQRWLRFLIAKMGAWILRRDTATELWNRWRGFQPWPGAFTTLEGKKLIVHRMRVAEKSAAGAPRCGGPRGPSVAGGLRAEHVAGDHRIADGRQEAHGRLGFSARVRDCIPECGWVEAMSAVSPARSVAFAILKAVEKGKGTLTICCGASRSTALSQADRNLATALVLGVLRWQIRSRPADSAAAETSECEARCRGADRVATWRISVAAHGSHSGARGDR